MSTTMTRFRRVGWSVVTLATVGLVGCTSFTFPSKGGAQDAPAELKDRKRMVEVPEGRFLMGYANAEPDEFPVHDVTISAFYMDRTEVPNGEYDACVDAEACRPTKYADDAVLGRARHPVVGVTWRDAKKYCKWVDKRLPTEAEWEYAARSPAFSVFPWAGRFQPTLVNSRGDVDGYAKTAPVGSFKEGASGLGIYDMAGNVAEWTSDAYDATYYNKSDEKDPRGPTLPTGSRVIRGGSWADNDYLVRSTARADMDPNVSKDSVGFRCAASVRRRQD